MRWHEHSAQVVFSKLANATKATCLPLTSRSFFGYSVQQHVKTYLNFNRTLLDKNCVLPTSSQSSEGEDIFVELHLFLRGKG